MNRKTALVALVFVLLASPVLAVDGLPPGASNNINTLSCGDIVGEGWNHMPDVADNVLSRRHATLLGFGSECHIGSLVFSECWLDPHVTVDTAIKRLLKKAANGKKLPDVPACGA